MHLDLCHHNRYGRECDECRREEREFEPGAIVRAVKENRIGKHRHANCWIIYPFDPHFGPTLVADDLVQKIRRG